MKVKLMLIIMLLCLCTAAFAQTAEQLKELDLPADRSGNPATVLFGFDGTAFKALNQFAVIFDSLHVDLNASVTTSWQSTAISAGKAGFLFFNHSAYAVACSTTTMTRAIIVPAGTPTFVPLVAANVFYKRAPASYDIEIQTGVVK